MIKLTLTKPVPPEHQAAVDKWLAECEAKVMEAMRTPLQNMLLYGQTIEPPPTRRVYTKHPGESVAVFEAEGTMEEAIAAVLADGYPRGLVLAHNCGGEQL